MTRNDIGGNVKGISYANWIHFTGINFLGRHPVWAYEAWNAGEDPREWAEVFKDALTKERK